MTTLGIVFGVIILACLLIGANYVVRRGGKMPPIDWDGGSEP